MIREKELKQVQLPPNNPFGDSMIHKLSLQTVRDLHFYQEAEIMI